MSLFQLILSVASASVGYAVAPPPDPLDLLIAPAFQFRIRGTSLDRVRRGDYSVVGNVAVRLVLLKRDCDNIEFPSCNLHVDFDDAVVENNSIELDTAAPVSRHLDPINRGFQGLIGPTVDSSQFVPEFRYQAVETILQRFELGDFSVIQSVAVFHSLQTYHHDDEHSEFTVDLERDLRRAEALRSNSEFVSTLAKFEAFMQFNRFFEDAWPNHLGNLDREWPVRRPSKESAECADFIW